MSCILYMVLGDQYNAIAGRHLFVNGLIRTALEIITEGGKVITFEGTFSFTGGTGKFKELKGKGTYKGSGDPQA